MSLGPTKIFMQAHLPNSSVAVKTYYAFAQIYLIGGPDEAARLLGLLVTLWYDPAP